MFGWRRRQGRPQRAIVAAAFLGAFSLTGLAAATPAAADSPRQHQWYIDAMGLPDIWKISDGSGITVAVIDGGVDTTVPDIQGQVLPGRDFSPNVSKAAGARELEHGTGMAQIIAGTGRGHGGSGAIGIAPKAKILPLRVQDDLHAEGQGASDAVVLPQIARAIRFAADSDARIMNISLGYGEAPPELRSAISYALGKGKLIFSSVGNHRQGGNGVEYPAGIPGVIGVAGLDKNGEATDESESGPQVALAAPGMDIVYGCTGHGTGYCIAHGTSDASAVAAGSAALVWADHPSWTGNEVLRALIKTAKSESPGERSDYIGYGLVRPRRAMQYTGEVGPADVNPLMPKATPTPSASSAPGSPAKPSASAPAPAAAAAAGGGSGATPWIVGGAVVVVAAIAVFALVRRRAR